MTALLSHLIEIEFTPHLGLVDPLSLRITESFQCDLKVFLGFEVVFQRLNQ